MRICTSDPVISDADIHFEKNWENISEYDCVIFTPHSLPLGSCLDFPSETKKIFWGNLNKAIETGLDIKEFDLFFSDDLTVEKVKNRIRLSLALPLVHHEVTQRSEIELKINQKIKKTEALQQEAMVNKEESTNIKGLGEYVIRLLGVNTVEQLVYETESLRILKYKGIKVSLIYVDENDGFLCTKNTTSKIKGFDEIKKWLDGAQDKKALANILSRPVLGNFKVYSENLNQGGKLYALFESQEEFLEQDSFLLMLQRLLFTNFIRVLQSERLLKNSSLLSQAFQQIQSTSLLIGSDYTVLFSNQKDSLNKKCYNYMFGRFDPCPGCPLQDNFDDSEDAYGREVHLSDYDYVVHSSNVKSLKNNFYLHIYETKENSQKRESIQIQRGKLQSIGLVTQALTHELNNPLTGILELASAMSKEFENQTLEDLNEISLAAERCLSIIETLKRFSSKRIEFSRVELSEVVKGSLVLTKLLTRSTSVHIDLQDEVWISGSSTLLSQLIFNIIKNSVEAMNGEGTISIKLTKNSGDAILIFEDTGPGLPNGMSDISLFGTKNKEEGTGFGLFLVNEFVKLHKGVLTFGNKPESGAYFKITIPCR